MWKSFTRLGAPFFCLNSRRLFGEHLDTLYVVSSIFFSFFPFFSSSLYFLFFMKTDKGTLHGSVICIIATLFQPESSQLTFVLWWKFARASSYFGWASTSPASALIWSRNALFAPQSNVGQMPQQHQSQDTHKPHWFPRQGPLLHAPFTASSEEEGARLMSMQHWEGFCTDVHVDCHAFRCRTDTRMNNFRKKKQAQRHVCICLG